MVEGDRLQAAGAQEFERGALGCAAALGGGAEPLEPVPLRIGQSRS
jgi:hypothetical protein